MVDAMTMIADEKISYNLFVDKSKINYLADFAPPLADLIRMQGVSLGR